MKVLIVDDEPIMRVGFRTLVAWQDNGFELIGEAGSGHEALQILEREPVDILVTDILMPQMDGLELMRQALQKWPDLRVVVISCLDGFESVKEAMKLGADDYFLKPTMETEDLIEVLKQIRLDVEQAKAQKKQLDELYAHAQAGKTWKRSSSLRGWLQGISSLAADERNELERFAPFYQLVILAFDELVQTLPHEQVKAIQELYRTYERDSEIYWIPMDAAHSVILLPAADPVSAKAVTASAAARIKKLSQDLLHTATVSVSVYISDTESLQALPSEYKAGCSLLESRFYLGGGKIFKSGDSLPFESDTALWWTTANREVLLEAVHTENRSLTLNIVERWCESTSRRHPEPQRVYDETYGLLNLMMGASAGHMANSPKVQAYFSYEKIESFLSWGSLKAWLFTVIEDFFSQQMLAVSIGENTSNPFIRRALRYMLQNYSSNLSLQDIADYVKLSRSYLSDLFSKETGETVSQVLTQIRIEKAKRLLELQNSHTYEVAEKVGFVDAKHFSKVFKRYTGLSPREYRESIDRNDKHQIE
ncbi:MAG: two-component system response regulator [Bacilli bacterium]|nr:two-component system response regulator [Bacilli bacterium]